MAAQGSTKTVSILGGSWSPNDKGYFVDLTALQTAYPTWSNGWFAITGTPDAIWIWDSGTSAWVNSGWSWSVTSVFWRVWAVVAIAWDYDASQITNTPSGNIVATTVQAAITELDTEKAKLDWGNVFTWNQTFDTDTLFIDSTNNRVWFWTITPSRRVSIDEWTVVANYNGWITLSQNSAGNVGTTGYELSLLNSTQNITAALRWARTAASAFVWVELNVTWRDGLRIQTGLSSVSEVMRINNSWNVSIWTTSSVDRLTVLWPDNTVPALWAGWSKFWLYNIFGGAPWYGMIFGVLADWKWYIQQQRVDGTATSYDLQLQPNWWTVSINPAWWSTPNAINIWSWGTYFWQVNGNTRIRSAFAGKTFDLQNSASVTKFSVDYDTWNVTAPNIVLKGAYWLIVWATKADYVVDGTADNVEVQAAIDASSALGWWTVWISSSVLSTTASITPKNGVTLRSLVWKTEIRAMSNIGYIFFSPATTTLTNFAFKDIIFNVNGQANNSWIQILRFDWLDIDNCVMKNSNGIWGIKVWHKVTTDAPSVHKSKNLRITNLHFDGGATATYEGLLYMNTDGVNIDGVTESGFSGAALISSYIYSTDVNLRRVNITPNAAMMAIDVTINDRCHIYDSSYINSHATWRTGVMIRNSRAVKVFRNHFELGTSTSDYWVLVLDWASSIDGHSLPSWNSWKSEYIEIYKNKLVNTYGITAHRNGVDTTCTVKDLSIHDNNIEWPNDTGIRVWNVSWAITDNIDNLSIYNNTINGRTSGTNDGISLLGTSSFKFRNLEMYGNIVTAGWGNTDGISIDYADSWFIGQNTLTPSGTWVAYNITNSPNLKWHSITQMSIISDENWVKLDGDLASPWNNKVYGTNASGVKGWKNDPAWGGWLKLPTYTVGASGADYTTIQGAIDAMTSWGNIFVIDGTYTLTSQLLLKYANTRITGNGNSTKIQANAATVTTLIWFNASNLANCSIENFYIANTNATTQGIWLNFSNTPLGTFRNLYFSNLWTAIRANDTANFTFYNKFEDIKIYECNNGFDFTSTNPFNDNAFDNVRVALKAGWAGKGLYMNNAQGNTFHNCNFEPWTGTGITGIHLDTNLVINTTFYDVYIENNATWVNIANAQRTTFIGWMIVANTTDITDTWLDTSYLNTNVNYQLYNQMANMVFLDKSNANRMAGSFKNNTIYAHTWSKLVWIELLNGSDTSKALEIKNAWTWKSISVMQWASEVMSVEPNGKTNVSSIKIWSSSTVGYVLTATDTLWNASWQAPSGWWSWLTQAQVLSRLSINF